MKVILFGATGMVGQGVLRECLRDDGVEGVLAVGRSSTGRTHPKLRELLRKDLFDFGAAGANLQGYDACFFCLGVSSAGMSEADYTRLTFDLTVGWAQALARINPAMTFVADDGVRREALRQRFDIAGVFGLYVEIDCGREMHEYRSLFIRGRHAPRASAGREAPVFAWALPAARRGSSRGPVPQW